MSSVYSTAKNVAIALSFSLTYRIAKVKSFLISSWSLVNSYWKMSNEFVAIINKVSIKVNNEDYYIYIVYLVRKCKVFFVFVFL